MVSNESDPEVIRNRFLQAEETLERLSRSVKDYKTAHQELESVRESLADFAAELKSLSSSLAELSGPLTEGAKAIGEFDTDGLAKSVAADRSAQTREIVQAIEELRQVLNTELSTRFKSAEDRYAEAVERSDQETRSIVSGSEQRTREAIENLPESIKQGDGVARAIGIVNLCFLVLIFFALMARP